MTVAGMLEDRKVAPWVGFGVTPGSRQVLRMVTRAGGTDTLVAAGARILESACGFCIGMGQAPATNSHSVRTGNRNYEGRSGTLESYVYLASPETAAASALAGEIIDPRDAAKKLKLKAPRVPMPKRFLIDDSEILAPAKDPSKVEILRGPNIGAPPVVPPLPDRIQGKVGIKVGDKVTTDHIMPAGSYMKYRSNIAKYAEFVFTRVDPAFAKTTAEARDRGEATLIVGGDSYGQGSSREHAAICPMFLGIRAVLAKALERIHGANLINFGILPLTFVNPTDYDGLAKGDAYEIQGIHEAVKRGFRLTLKNTTRGTAFEVGLTLTQRQREILLAGGLLNWVKQRGNGSAAQKHA
jgi:aconitate hydratase